MKKRVVVGGCLVEGVDEHVIRLAQKCIEDFPVIVLGSGASAPYGIPGMGELATWLIEQVKGDTAEEVAVLESFAVALKIVDLETALMQIQMSSQLTARVVAATWDLIAERDQVVFGQVVADRMTLPLSRLLRHLLSSTQNEVDIVTPNYDRLAEYAVEAAGLCHHTGFHYGNLRRRSEGKTLRIMENGKPARTVNIWKVHGSLDWFSDQDGVVLGLPIMSERLPGLMPVIVTPGFDKYRRTHDEPFRSVLVGAALHLRELALTSVWVTDSMTPIFSLS